ncbi:probable regulatory protein [Aromatoleum aromaticum EbN1]|uniref:Probable regulatory protein n=1 Tax=Aromatoleum aromaticum (strain DSM 19018 / LMG 30748 / EbN1) TaxID=76114 RepID=Q5P5Q4_AROAE|nr:helix-turn-helix domain-containing protein [Aromatoleum aromaticum]CAI07358.1 probable regulatory protein [Aromatoleum aromaticum EbN1]
MSSGLTQDRDTPRRRNERISIISTDDPCQHAASLRDWSQDYLQLSKGAFSGEIVEISVGPIQVFKETIYQCVDEKANPRCNSYTVGVPVSVTENGYWQGRHLERDSLITLRPNEELHFRTPRESTILVTVIDCTAFDAFVRDTAGVDVSRLIAPSNAAGLPADVAQSYRVTLGTVLASVAATPEIFEHQASAKSVAETVMSASRNALQAKSPLNESPRTTHAVQRAIVERARSYIVVNRENPPTVAELSSYLKMSRRGLHHAFVNVLGINVATFLRYVRLHGVRKELLRAGPTDSVSSIACKWGFWHMGMFSSYYKSLFGETPSTTMRKVSSATRAESHSHH